MVNMIGVDLFFNGGSHVVVANVLDCKIVVSEFKFQSGNNVHFQTLTIGKGMNSFIFQAMSWRVQLLLFNNNGFAIK